MSWPRVGSDCFLGPPAAFLLGSRLATGASGAPGFSWSPRLFLGLRLCFSRYQDCRCRCWSLGFHFTSPWAGSWSCCWGLEFQLAIIQICGWILGFHLCAAAQLYLCSPVVCIKILENKLTCRSGICLDKTFFLFVFFFLKQSLTTLTSASGSASVLSEGPFLLRRTKIM